jgi:hypothetical protein
MAMKTIAILSCGIALVLGVAETSRAQGVVDMSNITCEQLLTASPNAIDAAVWLSGYYNGLQKNTKLDLGQFKKNAEVIVAECRTNPKKTLMQTVDSMMSGKK